jgi:hypothetical protein
MASVMANSQSVLRITELESAGWTAGKWINVLAPVGLMFFVPLDDQCYILEQVMLLL